MKFFTLYLFCKIRLVPVIFSNSHRCSPDFYSLFSLVCVALEAKCNSCIFVQWVNCNTHFCIFFFIFRLYSRHTHPALEIENISYATSNANSHPDKDTMQYDLLYFVAFVSSFYIIFTTQCAPSLVNGFFFAFILSVCVPSTICLLHLFDYSVCNRFG